jgi:MFS family permease
MFSFLKGNVLVMTITRTLGFFARGAVFPYVSLYVLALGGTTTDVGFIDSLRPLASLLIFPIAGLLADRSGRVKLIVIAGYLSALTYLFHVFANDWIMLAVGNFINGMIVFHFPAQSALMADSLLPEQRGIGFATSSAIPGAIAVVAPYFAGYLIDKMGIDPAIRYLYFLLLASYAVSSTIQMKFLKDTVKRPKLDLNISKFKSFIVESYRSVIIILKWMPTSLRVLTLVIALSFTANAMCGPFWVIYGTQKIGLSASEWGLLILISSAFRIALSIPAGSAVDHFGKRKAIIASFILTIPAIFFFTYANDFIDVLIVLLILSTTNAILIPASSALLADLVPRDMRGRVMAAMGRGALMINPGRGGGGGPGMGYIFSLPVMFGAIIGGYIYSINPFYPWLLQSIFLLGSLIISLILLHEPEKAEI